MNNGVFQGRSLCISYLCAGAGRGGEDYTTTLAVASGESEKSRIVKTWHYRPAGDAPFVLTTCTLEQAVIVPSCL
jgi:hypothetical protein